MKNKFLISFIYILFIICMKNYTYATTGISELRASSNQIKKGESFTVVLSVESEDGINGVDTKYIYDTEKLEVLSAEIVDPSNWSDMGKDNDITVICNSTKDIKNADIYKIAFRLKDNVKVGDKIKIETSDILLDTNAKSNSTVDIKKKSVDLSIIDDKTVINDTNYRNENDSENNARAIKTKEIDETKSKNNLPKTGKYKIIAIFSIMGIIVYLCYKKYQRYKDIK